MKKIVFLSLFTICLFLASLCCAQAKPNTVQMLPALSSEANSANKLWVGTFQLVWNDFMDEVIKGPVNFVEGTPSNAEKLNKQEFKKSYLSEDSYYTAWGKTDLKLKAKIEKGIWAKFKEKSEILDSFDWEASDRAYFFYAMLKKDFKFDKKFDILQDDGFNMSDEKFPYFGIGKYSENDLSKGVDVLFYNNPFDYAVLLKSQKDDIILYRTNDNKSFDKLFNNLQKKSDKFKGNKKFASGDKLKVPFMTIKQETEFKELCNKQITGTNLFISKTIQTVDLKMNRSGVKLKSEAGMSVSKMSLPTAKSDKGRNFYFNNTFVLFMKEKNKSVPYFAARVKDMNMFKYKGEID